MVDIDFFRRLGVFVVQNFLTAQSCKKIYSAMDCSPSISYATVTHRGIDKIDETIRRTKDISVSNEIEHLVKQKLLSVQPQIEKHFSIDNLTGVEGPNFLAYREGDFFHPHIDRSTFPECHDYVRARKVSVVIFVNSQGELSLQNSYEGGELKLYGLIKKQVWEQYGFPVKGETGLLVAFPSDLWHEVTPVISGARFTIVAWFY